MEQLINDQDRIWHFLKDLGVPVMYTAGMQGIGREVDGALMGAVLYDGYTKNNIFMHCAGRGRRWISKKLLLAAFAYPFQQMNCKRITAWVDASNVDSRRFVENIGFEQEAVLKGAAHDGGDVILYVLWRDNCRFIRD